MSELFDRLTNLSPKRLALLAMDLQDKLDASERDAAQRAITSTAAVRADSEPIAIIGMACRLPGAPSVDAYWDLLHNGVDAIREVPPSRWDVDAFYDPDPDVPGRIATRWGGFLDDIDRFDPKFFGIAPREAQSLDPQQRLLLEVAWEALEDAAIAPDSLHGTSTGVYVGLCNSDYAQMLLAGDGEDFDMYLSTGNAGSVASGRLSYVLGLQGPAMTVDTACSSSLVAVHLAVQSLRSGGCRAALAGGVNVILSPKTTMTLSRAKMMAADGRCKAFDSRADGFVRGEGCGLIVLKRLSDAEADGDRVLAVIRGSAVNQDGRSNGLTAPNGPSQVAVIRAAIHDAGVEPGDVGYVETHGTGTALGDPIEAQALGAALGPGRSAQHRLMIGTAKTNLGHLESAAGIAGLIKVVLSLGHREIPPMLHLRQRNPLIAWDELPIDVPTQSTPWSPIGGRLIAGVSSFGFSGTNAHIVLEAGPVLAVVSDAQVAPDRPLHLMKLSARSEDALHELALRFAQHLECFPVSGLGDAAHSANVGRSDMACRLAVVAPDNGAAARALGAYAAGDDVDATIPGVIAATVSGAQAPGVALLFTGHGSQYIDMGRSLYSSSPTFRMAIDRCAELLTPLMDRPLLEVLFSHGGDVALLDSMAYAQPALFAVEFALAELWQSWGVRPTAVLGHSAGEYVAAVVAGVMSLDDGIKLIAARGRLMASLPPDGEMATVFATEEQVRIVIAPHAFGVSIAAINGPQSIALSGTGGSLRPVLDELRAQGVEVRPLAIPVAAHSPQVDSILDAFEQVAATVRYSPARMDVVSGMTGRLATGDDLVTAGYWRRHLRQPVRFADAFATVHDQGTRIFVEVGPHPTLLNMARHIVAEHECAWLSSLRSGHDGWQQMLTSAAALYTKGVALDWSAFDRPYARRKVSLPTYPFQRERHWMSPRSRALQNTSPLATDHPLLGRRVLSPAMTDVVFETELGATWPAFLDHHRIYGVAVLPSPAYLEMALAAAEAVCGDLSFVVADFSIREALVLPEVGQRPVQLVLHEDRVGSIAPHDLGIADLDDAGDGERFTFEIFSRAPAESTWTLHATGRLVVAAPLGDAERFVLDEVKQQCAQTISGDDYYAQLAESGLEFGTGFRGITDVWRRDGEALGRVSLPAELRSDADGYAMHPAMLDACFHLLGAPMLSSDEPQAYLLIGIDHLHILRQPGNTVWNHTVLRPGYEQVGAMFSGDIRLYNDDGELVAEVLGLQLKHASRDALMRSTQQHSHQYTYDVKWQDLGDSSAAQVVAEVEAVPETAQSWLLLACGPVGDDADLATQLAGQLSADGHRVAVTTRVLDSLGVEQALDQLPAGRRRIVFLGALSMVPVDALAYDKMAAEHSRALGVALAATQALAATGPGVTGTDTQLWIVTRGAQPAGNITPAPDQATLWGLGRVIALEHPQHWGGLIDLDPSGCIADDAAAVCRVIAAGGHDDQVAVRGERRLVPRLVRRGAAAIRASLVLAPDASYLVTGGLGGLGLKVALWMAESGARSIVLVGRRGLPSRDEWSSSTMPAEVSAQIAAIMAIEAAGASVEVVAADVADVVAMTALMARFGRDLAPLRGVVHAAAALSNWSVDALRHDALVDMLAPKVSGTWLLHQLTQSCELDFFVLFSSTTALLGARDMAHYAAANAFMDALAHTRRAQGQVGLSINWGTWDEMRVASAEDRLRVTSTGLNPLPTDVALRVMGDLVVANDAAQVMVAAVDWDVLKAVYEARRARPLLSLVAGRGVGRGNGRTTRRRDVRPHLTLQLASAPPHQRHDMVVSYLRNEVALALGMQPAESVDIDQGLFEMGMDSLMSVELKGRLEAAVGRNLPSTLTFNYPNIAALAQYLMDNVLANVPTAQLKAVGGDAEEGTSTASLLGHRDLADEVTEDQLAAMLSARLDRLR